VRISVAARRIRQTVLIRSGTAAERYLIHSLVLLDAAITAGHLETADVEPPLLQAVPVHSAHSGRTVYREACLAMPVRTVLPASAISTRYIAGVNGWALWRYWAQVLQVTGGDATCFRKYVLICGNGLSSARRRLHQAGIFMETRTAGSADRVVLRLLKPFVIHRTTSCSCLCALWWHSSTIIHLCVF